LQSFNTLRSLSNRASRSKKCKKFKRKTLLAGFAAGLIAVEVDHGKFGCVGSGSFG
jgi:hypothetical protein